MDAIRKKMQSLAGQGKEAQTGGQGYNQEDGCH